jgi:enoyl-CoA hydratase/carnithine racemase
MASILQNKKMEYNAITDWSSKMADLLFAVEGHIARITLNRPESINSFSEEMLDLWISALAEIRDSDEISAVVLSGNGKGFCSGGDIKAMADGKGFYLSGQDTASTGLARKNALWNKIQRIPLLFQEIDKPIIAKMHGVAFGAGLDMALACDLRFAAKSSKICESYLNVGVIPGDGGAYFLPRLVGIDKALDMFWTGRVLTADEAKAAGIVTFVIEDDELDNFTEAYLGKLVSGPQQAIRFTKRAVYQGQEMSLKSSLDATSSFVGLITELDSYKDRIKAVVSKK